VQNKWTKEETIIAFNVYCKIPFKESSKNHPLIIHYANLLHRSPSALNMKIGNFGRLDPELKRKGISGLSNGSKLEEVVWNEFHGNWEELAVQSELLIQQMQTDAKVLLQDIRTEKDAVVKTRLAQGFFRETVLASYGNKCCITGINLQDFLIASHIIPWAKNEKERLNPQNGLCLNSLHDKAFDRGFISIDEQYQLILSKNLKDSLSPEICKNYFLKYENAKISLPDKFLPNQEFLEYHREHIFKG
jgi:putative restriction endonuclease